MNKKNIMLAYKDVTLISKISSYLGSNQDFIFQQY